MTAQLEAAQPPFGSATAFDLAQLALVRCRQQPVDASMIIPPDQFCFHLISDGRHGTERK